MADEARTPSAAGLAARRAAVVSCWLCGIRLQQYQMVPDGGRACGDIRWYCKNTRACTERWTSARRQARAGRAASGPSAIAAPLSRQRSQPRPRNSHLAPSRQTSPGRMMMARFHDEPDHQAASHTTRAGRPQPRWPRPGDPGRTPNGTSRRT